MASVNRPEILLLSLAFQESLDEIYSSLLNQLSKSAQLRRIKTASRAIQYLDESKPRAIIVTDEGLTDPKNKAVLDKVVAYVRKGGLAIIGLHFPNFANFKAVDAFFGKAFGLPWKAGNYTSSDFEYNPSCTLPAATNSLPASCSMKALHVRDAQAHEKIYIPASDDDGGDDNDTPRPSVFSPAYVEQTQAAVVGTQVGNGYLAYVGDVNPGNASDRVILALCGL